MKYPRITYGEILKIATQKDPSLDMFALIYPNLLDIDARVRNVLEELGYSPVTGQDPSCNDFEIDYFSHSADKIVSPDFIRGIYLHEDPSNLIKVVDGVTYDDLVDEIDLVGPHLLRSSAHEFMRRHWANIMSVFNAYTTAYNPLDNYSMEEDIDYTPAVTTTTTSKTASKTKTENDNSIYGFNSATPVPSNKSEATTSQLQADNETEVSTSYDGETDNTHTERKGNIGVTTSQQMLQSEIELRKLEILELIFNGLDSVLTQAVY